MMPGWMWRELEDEPEQTVDIVLRVTFRQRARNDRPLTDVPSEVADYIGDHLTYLHKEHDVDFIVYGVTR